jgi:4-hydroxy-tetrahydrodipicolinate reductase
VQSRGRGVDFGRSILARRGHTGPRPRARSASTSCEAATSSAIRLIFAGHGEQLELAHHAQDRSGFAQGALAAARWVVARPPGLYSMRDVLGI